MRRLFIPVFVLLFISFLLGGCDSTTAPKKNGTGLSPVISNPRPDKEAEEAALWLSGELQAPEELYLTIKDDLARIRDAYLPTIPEVGITFFPPWEPGEILCGVTEEAKQQIQQGEYHDLDSLNAYYHLDGLDAHLLDFVNAIKLTFKGRLNPAVLSTFYGEVASVRYAEPNGYIGDWSNVYPWVYEDGMTYLFRKGEGDCLAGCIDSYFWYFRVNDAGVIEYVGTYKLRDVPEPSWWAEAKVGFERYRFGW